MDPATQSCHEKGYYKPVVMSAIVFGCCVAGVEDIRARYYFDGAPVVRFRKIQYMAFNLDGPPPADDDTVRMA